MSMLGEPGREGGGVSECLHLGSIQKIVPMGTKREGAMGNVDPVGEGPCFHPGVLVWWRQAGGVPELRALFPEPGQEGAGPVVGVGLLPLLLGRPRLPPLSGPLLPVS